MSWGLRFESPAGNQVMSVFCRGVERHGSPERLYLDNGKDFRMRRFAGGRSRPAAQGERIVEPAAVEPMLEMLGVEVTWALPYNAKAKIVEPFFRILSERFDKTFETYLGSKPERRPVTCHELAELVCRTRRTGKDGLVGQVALDVLRQSRHALVAAGRVFLERLESDRLHVATKRPHDGTRPTGCLLADHPHRFMDHRPLNVVRTLSCHHLVEDDAE